MERKRFSTLSFVYLHLTARLPRLFMMNENHQEERSIKLIIGSSIKCLKILKLTSVNTKSVMESHSSGPPASANNQQVRFT